MREDREDLVIPETDGPFVCSASQVDTFESCPRKWAWKHLDRIKGVTKYTERGIDTHAHLAKWLRARQIPPSDTVPGRLATAILKHLPAPQEVVASNVELDSVVQIGGIHFWLALDLYVPGRVPVVYDHKTTTDLKWALKPELFGEDIQASLYAFWGLFRTNASKVRLQWTYATTKNAPKDVAASRWQPKTLPVVQELCGRDIKERVSQTIETAKQIREVRESGVSAIDVPFDATACDDYGGCPYQSHCNLSPEARLEAIMSTSTSKEDFMAKLRARKAGAANGASANPNPVNPTPPATASKTQSLADKLRQKAQGAAAPAAAVPAATPPAETAPPAEEKPARRGPGRPRKNAAPPESAAESQSAAVADAEAFVKAMKDFEAAVKGHVWMSAASAALSAVLAHLDMELLLEEDSRAEAVAIAASLADLLAKESEKRS